MEYRYGPVGRGETLARGRPSERLHDQPQAAKHRKRPAGYVRKVITPWGASPAPGPVARR